MADYYCHLCGKRTGMMGHYQGEGKPFRCEPWQSIEELITDPIWVIKYDIFFYPEGHELYGNFCQADDPGAVKSTSCHGWYENEADAMKVLNHFPKPNTYRLEKVWKRRLK